ncbi:class I SAM-dependent methyltransferase [Demequina litorisediminis]|uniref:16S RNA G1207 methylase RsmC n=1 Tax=Demequina litorisediminis TaxID=1849022 RepID=A0ABQ6IJ00_9MICO|nr:methyltransferase [Demequina litorisediminis]GMA37127.1 16S RNA G1207 methylase RsmC [Demequina litorisediminis]
MTDHYFSAEPASADERRLIRVALAGREVDLETAAGVFSPGHLDLGTQVLLRHLPPPPDGRLLDLGCGWGPLALTAALQRPGVKVTAVDVNRRALDLLARNAARLGATASIEAREPDEVPAKRRFDAIWSNPPIRIGKPQLHALLTAWLPRLKPEGEAHLVVQKNLGADSLAGWIADQGWGDIEKVGSAKGFRVLKVTRAAE